MNKHVIIVIVASAIIVGSVAYSISNVLFLDSLQFKWNERGSFDYLTMLNGGVLEVCNSSSIPIHFNNLKIITTYQDSEVGTFEVKGTTIQPNSKTELKGEGEITSIAGQMISMYLDTELSGTDIMRVDSNAMKVTATVNTAIFGIIPYVASNEFTAKEFLEIMNGKNENYAC